MSEHKDAKRKPVQNSVKNTRHKEKTVTKHTAQRENGHETVSIHMGTREKTGNNSGERKVKQTRVKTRRKIVASVRK